MATQTTYYEFNKPEGTDLVNPLVDTNPNWDALDADLHEFNERSISNATEIVALGVHTISRLDTTAKFLKWIATANFTAGETFTVDGLPVAATTPAGAALATNAYVTGSVVLACLNADNTAMTIFVSGTNVATDSERLGGALPSYYGTASDVSNNATDITNLQNQVGNTSIVGIGDGTCTGAIDALNTDLSDILAYLKIPKAIYFNNGTVTGVNVQASNNPADFGLAGYTAGIAQVSDTLLFGDNSSSAFCAGGIIFSNINLDNIDKLGFNIINVQGIGGGGTSSDSRVFAITIDDSALSYVSDFSGCGEFVVDVSAYTGNHTIKIYASSGGMVTYTEVLTIDKVFGY